MRADSLITYLCLLDDFLLQSVFVGFKFVCGFDTDFTASPFLSNLKIVVVLGTEVLDQGFKVSIVLLAGASEGDSGGSLLVDEFTKSRLSLDEAVWDFLLSAEGWEPHNELDWVDIMSNDDELGLLVLDEVGDVVETVFQDLWLGSLVLLVSTFNLVLSGSQKSLFLLFLAFSGVLGEESEEVAGLVGFQGVGELIDGWWDLQSLHEDSLLTLELDVSGPSDETGQVTTMLDVIANSEVAWSTLEQWVSLNSWILFSHL